MLLVKLTLKEGFTLSELKIYNTEKILKPCWFGLAPITCVLFCLSLTFHLNHEALRRMSERARLGSTGMTSILNKEPISN